jgi:hypothetical protein
MRDSLGAALMTVRVRGPAGSYEVPVHRESLLTRFWQGAALAAGLTTLRLVVSDRDGLASSHAALGLMAVAFGGGVGGLVYYATDPLRVRGGARRTIANVISLLVYAFATLGALVLVGLALDDPKWLKAAPN